MLYNKRFLELRTLHWKIFTDVVAVLVTIQNEIFSVSIFFFLRRYISYKINEIWMNVTVALWKNKNLYISIDIRWEPHNTMIGSIAFVLT